MFGIGKSQEELQKVRGQLEKLEEMTSDIIEKQGVYEAGISDMDNSRAQMKTNMEQVDENNASSAKQAEQNITKAAELSGQIKTIGEQMETSEKEYGSIVEQFKKQVQECMELVDKNKYFTPPSKFINEAPKDLKNINQSYLESVDKVEEYSKQIGVIALNMAIEAGRMGESGLQFVSAAEEVRKFAADFEDLITEMKTLVTLSNSKLDEFENQSSKLIGLLKDNNVATVHLYNTHQKTEEMIDNSSIHPYSGDIRQWREEIIGIRNTEEEILKLQERSRIQNEDIRSEMEAQQQTAKEIDEKLKTVFQAAKSYRS